MISDEDEDNDDDNDNYSNDNDNDNDYDNDNDNDNESDIPADLLTVTRTLTDDLFVGSMSKYIFQREPSCAWKRFIAQEELTFYLKFHLQPTLREILSDTSHRFFLWIAAEIQFVKLIQDDTQDDNDRTEECQRWSSMRNQSTFAPNLHSPNQTTTFINEFTKAFAEEVLTDIAEMEELFSSG